MRVDLVRMSDVRVKHVQGQKINDMHRAEEMGKLSTTYSKTKEEGVGKWRQKKKIIRSRVERRTRKASLRTTFLGRKKKDNSIRSKS